MFLFLAGVVTGVLLLMVVCAVLVITANLIHPADGTATRLTTLPHR